ncbi:hypothetical protein C8R47DRAFT_1301592 [Mycena vitilis]|nr:hypothetical protein C8R47DRAFT_1301592 [Mycena vitilis]
MSRATRARLVVASFLPAFFYEGYALFDRRDAPGHAVPVYAPHPYLLIILLAMQVGVQAYWIFEMVRGGVREIGPGLLSVDGGLMAGAETDYSVSGELAEMAYAPLYVLGNVFIAGSMAAWIFECFTLSQVCMAFNTACQLYSVFFILPASGRHAWTPHNRLTHLVAKTGAGMAILHMWRGWGIMKIGSASPAIQQQAHVGVLVLLLVRYSGPSSGLNTNPRRTQAFASGPDPTLGICLLLDLGCLFAGDTKEDWKFAFSCIMGVLSVVIVSDCVLAWKGRRASDGVSLAEDEESGRAHEHIWLPDMSTHHG